MLGVTGFGLDVPESRATSWGALADGQLQGCPGALAFFVPDGASLRVAYAAASVAEDLPVVDAFAQFSEHDFSI